MKLFFSLCLCFSAGFVLGQQCDCLSQLSFVINYYEQNNPAFQKIKVNPASHKLYLREVQKIKKEAGSLSAIDPCIISLDRYVGLLKDHHSEIGFNLKRTDLGTQEKIADFKKSASYRGYTKVKIDTAQLIPLLQSKKAADIEGIYSNGSSIIFGIFQQDKNPDHYIGVVLRENKLLDVGHVLLELNRTQENSYNVTYNIGLLGFNFQKIFKSQRIENGLIPGFGFSKTNPRSTKKEYEFKMLNDSTNYIRVSSFDAKLTDELDSFYRQVDKEIRDKPYLVVDIRNNGGGSERSYFNLLAYAYTKPLKLDSALVWVSPENIKRYEEAAPGNHTRLIERMKTAKPFSFIPQTEESTNTWALDSATIYPKKIALLYDRGTASSGEGLIVYFKQSDKVITIGENSGGYMGYGNVMTAQTPCEQFTIRSTTTRYFEKSQYEFVGVEPMYKVSRDQDWIKYAQELLNKKQ